MLTLPSAIWFCISLCGKFIHEIMPFSCLCSLPDAHSRVMESEVNCLRRLALSCCCLACSIGSIICFAHANKGSLSFYLCLSFVAVESLNPIWPRNVRCFTMWTSSSVSCYICRVLGYRCVCPLKSDLTPSDCCYCIVSAVWFDALRTYQNAYVYQHSSRNGM